MTEQDKTSFDCTDIKALLSALVDDELTAEKRHHAERHLTECDDCRALLTEAERCDGLLAAAVADGPAVLSEGFEEVVLRRTVHAGRAHGGFRSWLGWFAAAATFVGAVTMWIIDGGSRAPAELSGEVVHAVYPTGGEIRSWSSSHGRRHTCLRSCTTG